MDEVEQKLKILNEKCPLVAHTGTGQLSSTVRRMRAQKEIGIPINRRTGFAVSVKHRKAANELDATQWDEFYNSLCGDLKNRYPDLYMNISPD